MSVEDNFRHLLTSTKDDKREYFGLKFSFETVVCQMLPGYDYTFNRGCPCSIEHEFMLYLKNGTISDEILNRVTHNIVTGKCPHVDETKRTVVSSISGFHVAAAVNTQIAITEDDPCVRRPKVNPSMDYVECPQHLLKSGVFNLEPYRVAIMKDNPKTYSRYLQYRQKHYTKPDYGAQSGCRVYYVDSLKLPLSDSCLLKIYNLNDLELCVIIRNLQAFSIITRNHVSYEELYNVLDASKTDDDLNVLIAVQTYIRWLLSRDDFMSYITGHGTNHSLNMLKTQILKLFDIESNKMLKAGLQAKSNRNEIIINTLNIRKKEFFSILKSNEVIMQSLYELAATYSILHFWATVRNGSDFLRYLFDLGYSIDDLDEDGLTSLGRYFSSFTEKTIRVDEGILLSSMLIGFRIATLEYLIYENSSIKLNKSAVASAIQHDKIIYEVAREDDQEDIKALLDDWMVSPLSFPAALLMESGFPVTRDVLLKALDDGDLHPAELDYIRTCLDTPRRLTHTCRDVIRVSFKGRLLHTFIETSNIPNKIKDFILIRWLLEERMPQ